MIKVAIQEDEVLINDKRKQYFNLIWDGSHLESNPPQVNLVLTLNKEVGNPTCARLWSNTLEFNLEKIDLAKDSVINLFDSFNPNAPRYKLVYKGKDELNGCEVIGFIDNGNYCSSDKVLVPQKDIEGSCTNNFECKTNICDTNKCVNSSLIGKIFNWFKRLFGIN